jgi:hypothetical protein
MNSKAGKTHKQTPDGNIYGKIIAEIFAEKYIPGCPRVEFERRDIEKAAASLKIALPKNLGDLIYSFRYRQWLPESVRRSAPAGKHWVIRPAGRSQYAFEISTILNIKPNPALSQTSVPDATPGIIEMHRLTDEQAMLARIRYNRLIDIFTSVTCYALQSHLRTTVPGMGQVETDELYVGLDKRGAQFVFPVQAKRGNDRLSVVQIEQDLAMCKTKFPSLICVPIAACAMDDRVIALFSFEPTARHSDNTVAVTAEKHYRLVPPEEISAELLATYSQSHLDRH